MMYASLIPPVQEEVRMGTRLDARWSGTFNVILTFLFYGLFSYAYLDLSGSSPPSPALSSLALLPSVPGWPPMNFPWR